MDNELISGFSVKKDKTQVQEFYNLALNILTSALDDLYSENNSEIIKLSEETTRIFPMGDYTNDTFIDQTGELEIVVATSDPQVILNNNNYMKEVSSTKNKKKIKEISRNGTVDILIYKLLEKLVSYFNETTTLFLTNDGIKILCLKEYGFKILIRFATYNIDDVNAILYFWDPLVKTQKATNLFEYNEQIEKKNSETNGNYKKLVRIYKNIRKTILLNKWSMSSELNKYFVELIIFNVPNSLMVGNDIVKIFYKSYNYLINCNILNFVSFDKKRINTFSLAKINFYKINNYIRLVKKLI